MIIPNILLTVIVGAAFSLLLWRFAPPVWAPVQIAGVCVMVVSFVLWTVARFQLGKSLAVTAQAKQLVTRGLYSKIRNPIYMFASCTIAGVILALARPAGLLVFVAIIPLQLWRARKEAQVLEAKFGDEYRQYRSGTWF